MDKDQLITEIDDKINSVSITNERINGTILNGVLKDIVDWTDEEMSFIEDLAIEAQDIANTKLDKSGNEFDFGGEVSLLFNEKNIYGTKTNFCTGNINVTATGITTMDVYVYHKDSEAPTINVDEGVDLLTIGTYLSENNNIIKFTLIKANETVLVQYFN